MTRKMLTQQLLWQQGWKMFCRTPIKQIFVATDLTELPEVRQGEEQEGSLETGVCSVAFIPHDLTLVLSSKP